MPLTMRPLEEGCTHASRTLGVLCTSLKRLLQGSPYTASLEGVRCTKHAQRLTGAGTWPLHDGHVKPSQSSMGVQRAPTHVLESHHGTLGTLCAPVRETLHRAGYQEHIETITKIIPPSLAALNLPFSK